MQPAAAEEFRSAADFPASTDVLVPSGAKARARANIAAIELVHTLRDAGRPATLPEQRTLAAWSGWGAIPQVFDPRADDFTTERAQLAGLLTPEQYRQKWGLPPDYPMTAANYAAQRSDLAKTSGLGQQRRKRSA